MPTAGPVATIMIGAVVCCAASIAGDNLQDLKAGHMIGASPWRQQVMLGVGAIATALIMAPMLNLLLKAYGMGPATAEHPHSLQAAQATLDGIRRARHVRRPAAVEHGDRRHHHRRGDHRGGRDPESHQQDRHSRARAGGGRRHLSAARAGSAYFPGRPARVVRAASAARWRHGRRAALAGGHRAAERAGACCSPPGLITGESLIGVAIAHRHRAERAATSCSRCRRSSSSAAGSASC